MPISTATSGIRQVYGQKRRDQEFLQPIYACETTNSHTAAREVVMRLDMQLCRLCYTYCIVAYVSYVLHYR